MRKKQGRSWKNLIFNLNTSASDRPSTIGLQPYSSGFTLIEIIIVLTIIGIASAIVGIMINQGSSRLEFRSFTKDLSATLRYARNHAVSEKKTYCFVINKDDGMFRLYGGEEKSDSNEELVPIISKPIPDDIEVTMNEDDADFYQIEFFPQGNSSGGVIELRNPGGSGMFITVNRISGKVEVENAE